MNFADSRRRYINIDLYKNKYVVATLNDLKPEVNTQQKVAEPWTRMDTLAAMTELRPKNVEDLRAVASNVGRTPHKG